ncbi:hypothetical protein [Streptomyces sp. NPDC092307]|uniref:hypothetical protein n=1 Tax=Streptomyces sp. NPDC092307 TaxID=3366013 RepID=UPI003819B04F
MTSDSLRSLARSLAPLPEESLPDFLLRLAFRLDSAPGRPAQLVGLSHRQYRLPAEFLIELPEPIAEVFGAVTRLSATDVRSMTGVLPGLPATDDPRGQALLWLAQHLEPQFRRLFTENEAAAGLPPEASMAVRTRHGAIER